MLNSDLIITHFKPKSPISEAYRVLRTNIQYSSFDKPLKVIVVTSSGPGEGKTTTVINLAVSFTQVGSRVLVIDGDLRRPKVHKVFGLRNNRGLTNFLVSRDDYRDYINKSGIENLDIITCGTIPPNPSELLNSNVMKQFIETARNDYDMVIIDSSPVGSVTDAAILSTIVDGTILVASSGDVQIDAFVRAKELLDKINANIIGVVLNKIEKKTHEGYYYYYKETDEMEFSNSARKKHRKRIKKKLAY